MSKRIITFLLAAAMLTLIACGNTQDSGSNTTAPDSADTTAADTEPAEKLEIPGGANYGGYTFRILSRPGNRLNEVYSEEETGEALSDSVYRRNITVEDKLGIKFEVIVSSSDWETDGLNSILAGEDAYDAIATAARAAFIYAQKLAVMNWFDLPYVDMTKSWWNQNAADNLAIGGKLYAAAGDISYATIGATVGMVFNKELFDDYQLEYPYESVNAGTWTFDEFAGIAKNFSQDLNGDGEMKIEDDLFGYGSNHWMGPIEALYCTGERIITVDKDGYPQLTLYSEKVVDMYDKYMNLLLSECGWNQLGGNTNQQAFCEGRMAMVDLNTWHLSESFFRGAEIEFGLVPWPKSDEDVDKYYSFVDAGHSLWVVPVTVSDPERTGVVLETNAYYGQQIIIPAYYDITLQNKYLRDEMSVTMLDYIKDGAVFDLGYYNNTQFGGDLANPGYNLVHDTTLTFTTLYSKYEQSVKTLIDKSMKVYLEAEE